MHRPMQGIPQTGRCIEGVMYGHIDIDIYIYIHTHISGHSFHRQNGLGFRAWGSRV